MNKGNTLAYAALVLGALLTIGFVAQAKDLEASEAIRCAVGMARLVLARGQKAALDQTEHQ